MPLLLPKINMQVPQDNLPATPSTAGNAGWTSVTASASANTKGSWTQLISSTTYDTYGFMIGIMNDATSAAVRRSLYDIGIGAAAAEQVIVPNIVNTLATGGLPFGGPNWSYWPIFIPKGTRISARKQCSTGSVACGMSIFCYQGLPGSGGPVFSAVDAIGIDTSTSSGFQHTPGNTGTYSSWTDMPTATTTSRQYFGMNMLAMQGTDTTMTALAGYMEWGVGSTTYGRRIFVPDAVEFVRGSQPFDLDYRFIPSGTQLQMRATMSGTSDSDYHFALYGFY